jgi:hypothetical protein
VELMRHSFPTLVLLLSALLACKSLKEKVSGPAPAASASATSSATGSAASGGEVPTGAGMDAPTSPLPRPLKTGQFVRYKVVQDGKESEMSYSVLGQEADAHWIQFVTSPKGRRVVIQLLLHIGDRNHPKSAKLLGVKMKMGSTVREFRGAMLARLKNEVSGAMAELNVPSLQGLEQEDVTVPAGTFKNSYKRESTMTLYGFQDKSRQWLHTGLPVLTLVKAQSQNHDHTMELVAYGETGAKDELE